MDEINYGFWAIFFLAVAALIHFGKKWLDKFQPTTIYDYQAGLLYKNGKLDSKIGAGRYKTYTPTTYIHVVDLRPTTMTLSGQDILTKDNVNLKLSMTGTYQIIDVVMAAHSNESAVSALYNDAQMVLRDVIANRTFEEVLEKRSDIDAELLARVSEDAKKLGMELSKLAVRDVILPANLKKAYAGVLEAQKEAQRKIEEARGEHAVLRNLANASQMFAQNPMLYQARLLQALSSGNNSVVLNIDGAKIEAKPAKPVTKA